MGRGLGRDGQAPPLRGWGRGIRGGRGRVLEAGVLGGGGCSYLCALASRTPRSAEVGGGALLPLGLRLFHAGERPQPTPRGTTTSFSSSSTPEQFDEESLSAPWETTFSGLDVSLRVAGFRRPSPLLCPVPLGMRMGSMPILQGGRGVLPQLHLLPGRGHPGGLRPHILSRTVRAKAPLGLAASSALLGKRL